jgi:hypothetical protein
MSHDTVIASCLSVDVGPTRSAFSFLEMLADTRILVRAAWYSENDETRLANELLRLRDAGEHGLFVVERIDGVAYSYKGEGRRARRDPAEEGAPASDPRGSGRGEEEGRVDSARNQAREDLTPHRNRRPRSILTQLPSASRRYPYMTLDQLAQSLAALRRQPRPLRGPDALLEQVLSSALAKPRSAAAELPRPPGSQALPPHGRRGRAAHGGEHVRSATPSRAS